MKFRRSFLVIITVVGAIFLFGSCFSGPSTGGGLGLNPFGGLRQAASDRASAEIASATGLTGMTNRMMFNMMYSQVFFIGGFGANFYELEETQGTIWRVESRDEDGHVSSVEAERALLKKLPGGDEWWYLAWRADGDQMEYEALMNSRLQAKKIRYYNPEVKRVEETVFKDAASSGSGETPPPEPAVSEIDMKELATYSKGKETIRVNSGTYTADRLEWSALDEEEKTTYSYVWWVDPKAVGGLVKYEWTKSGSRESINGELYSVKKGYTTKFNSF